MIYVFCGWQSFELKAILFLYMVHDVSESRWMKQFYHGVEVFHMGWTPTISFNLDKGEPLPYMQTMPQTVPCPCGLCSFYREVA